MDWTKFKVKGYHYNPNVIDKMHSAFYDSDKNEDDFFKISFPANNQKIIVVTYTKDAEEILQVAFEIPENLEDLNKQLEYHAYLPE